MGTSDRVVAQARPSRPRVSAASSAAGGRAGMLTAKMGPLRDGAPDAPLPYRHARGIGRRLDRPAP